MSDPNPWNSGAVTGAYVNDVYKHALLSPQQEADLLRDFFESEVDLFTYLLSDPTSRAPFLPHLPGDVRGSIPGRGVWSRSDVRDILRLVRFGEEGRTWMSMVAGRARGPALELRRKTRNILSKFVTANLRLVIHIAKRYSRRCQSLTMDDLVQEGNVGLVKSAERFDHERGLRFSTYAQWWIKATIRRAIAEKEAIIRIPVRNFELSGKVNLERQKYTAAFGHEPSVEDLAKVSGTTPYLVRSVEDQRISTIVSLDSPIGENGTVEDIVADTSVQPADDIIHQSRAAEAVQKALSRLTPFEADVIRRRFGLGDINEMTLSDLGERNSLSRERIRQIEAQALRKLRDVRMLRSYT